MQLRIRMCVYVCRGTSWKVTMRLHGRLTVTWTVRFSTISCVNTTLSVNCRTPPCQLTAEHHLGS